VSPSDAFAGTFHINELYSQMERSYAQAHAGELPEVFPCEIYCHTLTDPSILGKDLQRIGYQTITVFGIDMACHLFETDNEAKKEIVVQKFFDGINTYLAEPMQDCLAKDSSGNWCIEAKSSIDLQEALGMPRGNIFHGQLSWFFTESDSQSGTWGVETPHERVFLCGSAAMRGGAVSGIPGRSAAMKILGLS
jgi:phytoene dehydrogenase-like protein